MSFEFKINESEKFKVKNVSSRYVECRFMCMIKFFAKNCYLLLNNQMKWVNKLGNLEPLMRDYVMDRAKCWTIWSIFVDMSKGKPSHEIVKNLHRMWNEYEFDLPDFKFTDLKKYKEMAKLLEGKPCNSCSLKFHNMFECPVSGRATVSFD